MEQTERGAGASRGFPARLRHAAAARGAPGAVAWLFLASGVVGLTETGHALTQGRVSLSPLLAGLPVGLGLLRLAPGWRVAATVTAALFLLVDGLWLVSVLLGGPEYAARVNPSLPTSPWRLLPAACVAVWAIVVLSSSAVRARFELAEAGKSDAARFARTISALLVVAAVLGASRATGRSLSAYWFGSGGRTLTLQTSRPRELAYPLVIEIRGDGCVSFVVVTNWLRYPEGPSGSDRFNARYRRYEAVNVPEEVARAEDRVIARIEDVHHRGLTRTPLLKAGLFSCRVALAGVGRYQGLEIQKTTSRYYWLLGPCTTEEALGKVRGDVEDRVRSWIDSHVLAALRKPNLEALEGAWRARSLSNREVGWLAYARRRRGDAAFRAGEYRSASRNYEDCLIGLEYELAGAEQRIASSPGTVSTLRDWRRAQVVRWDLAGWTCHVAWRLATDPRPEARDGVKALELARRGCALVSGGRKDDFGVSEAYEALAAALAETGDFAGAVRWQRHAIGVRLEEARGGWRSLFRGRFEAPDDLPGTRDTPLIMPSRELRPSRRGEADDPALAEYLAGRPFRDAHPETSLATPTRNASAARVIRPPEFRDGRYLAAVKSWDESGPRHDPSGDVVPGVAVVAGEAVGHQRAAAASASASSSRRRP